MKSKFVSVPFVATALVASVLLTTTPALAFDGVNGATVYSASAQDKSLSDRVSVQSTPQLSANDKRNLDAVLGAVQENNLSRQFDYARAIDAGADPQFAQEFASVLSRNGGEVLNYPGILPRTEVSLSTRAAAACLGKNYGESPWYGVRLYRNSCEANALAAAMGIGAGAATLAALLISGTIVGIPISLVSGIVAALLAMGGGVILYCAREGEGITLNIPYVGVPNCTTQ